MGLSYLLVLPAYRCGLSATDEGHAGCGEGYLVEGYVQGKVGYAADDVACVFGVEHGFFAGEVGKEFGAGVADVEFGGDNIVAATFEREGAGEGGDSGFGGGVSGRTGAGSGCGDGSVVDDAPATVVCHVGKCGLGDQEGAAEVGGDAVVEGLDVDGVDAPGWSGGSGVVDDQGQWGAGCGFDGAEHFGDLVGVGDVARVGGMWCCEFDAVLLASLFAAFDGCF